MAATAAAMAVTAAISTGTGSAATSVAAEVAFVLASSSCKFVFWTWFGELSSMCQHSSAGTNR